VVCGSVVVSRFSAAARDFHCSLLLGETQLHWACKSHGTTRMLSMLKSGIPVALTKILYVRRAVLEKRIDHRRS